MKTPVKQKDPNAVLDYQHSWTTWLNGDTISTSTWLISPTETGGLTVNSSSKTTNTARVWLSAGVDGNSYIVTNRIVTAGGRIADKELIIEVTQKAAILLSSKSKVAIISGIPASSFDDLWVTMADNYIKGILGVNFTSENKSQYYDLRNRNDFVSSYDRVRKFTLSHIPVVSFTSLIYKPYESTPQTLVQDTDYFVNLDEGTFELSDDFEPDAGQRQLKANYVSGYSSSTIPQLIKDWANYLAAFMVESEWASVKGETSGILKEVEIGRYRELYDTASTALKTKYSILDKLEAECISRYKKWE